MPAISTLFVELRARTAKLNSDMGKAVQLAERTGQTMSRVGQRMSLAISLPIAALATASIKAASDAEEMGSKFDAVFKDLSGDVKAWADVQAAATNRSSLDLQEYLSTIQDTLVPMGMMRDSAADLSKSVVTLAVDLASFNNQAESDVIRDLQSAMVGNTETVRKYGIVITQATLDQELLNQGIEGGVESATEAQKVQARLAIIMRSTSDAHGDAARTAESFSNQMRGLSAAGRDVLVNFGNELLPIATRFVSVGAGILRWVNQLTPKTKQLALTGAAILAAVGPLAVVIGTVVAKLAVLTPILTAIAGLLLGPLGLVALVVAATAAVVIFRNEVGAALLQALSLVTEKMADLLEWLTAIPVALRPFGADFEGMAATLRRFSADTADNANALLEQESAITQTGQAARDAVDPIQDFTVSVEQNTDGLNKNLAIIKQFKTRYEEHQDFVKATDEAYEAWGESLGTVGDMLGLLSTDARELVNVPPPTIADTLMWQNATNEATRLDDVLKHLLSNEQMEYDKKARDWGTFQDGLKRTADQTARDMQRRFGDMFTAVIVKGENAFTSIKTFALTIANSLAQEFFEKIGGAIARALGTVLPGFGGGAAGGAAAGGAAAFGTAGAAVAAAFAGFTVGRNFRRGANAASAFVEHFQDPIGDILADLASSFRQTGGTIIGSRNDPNALNFTLGTLQQFLEQLSGLQQLFNTTALDFGARTGTTVGTQAVATMGPVFAGLFQELQRFIDMIGAALEGRLTDTGAIVSGIDPATGEAARAPGSQLGAVTEGTVTVRVFIEGDGAALVNKVNTEVTQNGAHLTATETIQEAI